MKPRQAKRSAPARGNDERRRNARNGTRSGDGPPRRKPTREQRPLRSGPQTNPIPRPKDAPARPKNASQAKARAKARKAKAPKVVRPPLRERISVKLASIDLNPRTLVARVPFVVLVIGSLGAGLGTTLWLSTDAAERSYQLDSARETNQALSQQKEALERDVLEAQAPPALAEAARDLGMIPSRDTAHLVQDAAGNWIVVGTPKPAEGVPPPPLNTPLPEDVPPAPPPPPAPRVVEPRELTVRMPPRPALVPTPGVGGPMPIAPAAPLATAPGAEAPHAAPGPLPALGPAPVAPPIVAPVAPVAPVVDQPLTAPLDAGAPHEPNPAGLPGPATEQFSPAVPPRGPAA
jgi:cell division protein FtsB